LLQNGAFRTSKYYMLQLSVMTVLTTTDALLLISSRCPLESYRGIVVRLD